MSFVFTEPDEDEEDEEDDDEDEDEDEEDEEDEETVGSEVSFWDSTANAEMGFSN